LVAGKRSRLTVRLKDEAEWHSHKDEKRPRSPEREEYGSRQPRDPSVVAREGGDPYKKKNRETERGSLCLLKIS